MKPNRVSWRSGAFWRAPFWIRSHPLRCLGLGALLCISADGQMWAQRSFFTPLQKPGGQVEYEVAERGPHHRTWQKILTTTNAQGRAVSQTNLAYIELATGMHYQENGQWHEAQEVIESFPDGAIARRGAHRVIFANNLNVAGAVDLQMPDGRRLRIGVGMRMKHLRRSSVNEFNHGVTAYETDWKTMGAKESGGHRCFSRLGLQREL